MKPTFQLRDYPIFVGDLLDFFPNWIQKQAYSQYFIITDEHTRRQCLQPFLDGTGLDSDMPGVTIPAGERFKNMATCEQIWQAMFDAGLDREALVINLGGGVIGDMGGFCAATYKRGVDFIQVPTTLLSMTDAAAGGKLAVDFQGIKNAVGLFKNPAAVFVEPVFLDTLPARELRSGFGEVIKHAMIGDPALWDRIVKLDSLDGVNWFDFLNPSIAVKVKVVEEDPLEKGLRAVLNFGHTIGHALESYYLHTASPLAHGEAVAIGMVCEAELAPKKAKLRTGELISIVQRFYPHRVVPESALPELWNLMQQDKKNAAGAVRMALPDAEPYTLHLMDLTYEDLARSLMVCNML
jgi:3-dehydroquinate synthase